MKYKNDWEVCQKLERAFEIFVLMNIGGKRNVKYRYAIVTISKNVKRKVYPVKTFDSTIPQV